MKQATNVPRSPLPADVAEAIAALDDKHHAALVRMLRQMLVRKPRPPRVVRPPVVAPPPPADAFQGVYGLGERPRNTKQGAVFGAVKRFVERTGGKAA